jgi:hypothetical protein
LRHGAIERTNFQSRCRNFHRRLGSGVVVEEGDDGEEEVLHVN